MQYIASPYSHNNPKVQEQRYESVCRHLVFLVSYMRVLAYSPIAHCRSVAILGYLPQDWDTWKKHNFDMIKRMDTLRVLMLPGWRQSKGVMAEIAEAERLGIPIFYDEFLEYETGKEVEGGIAPITKEAFGRGREET